MVTLDSRFIGYGSMVYLAVVDGRNHVYPANAKPATCRSNAGQSVPHYANHFHRIYVVLPVRSGVVLDREQQYYDSSAMVY